MAVSLDNFKVKISVCARGKEFIVLCINKSDVTGIFALLSPSFLEKPVLFEVP